LVVYFKELSALNFIIQEEIAASVASILGKTYVEVKSLINVMGIFMGDKSLWPDRQ